jgi:catechol 2,3-dioxygenase-like lactoylglutathione lyase family enzyme
VSVLGIDHAGITVASIKAALVFYRDLLGLTVTDEGEDAGPELDAI